MNTTVISIRTDKALKDEAQKIAKSAGFSLSTLLNAYMHKLVATRHIDFFAPPEKMTPKMEKIIGEIEKDRRHHNGPDHDKYFSPSFTNAKDAIAWLNSDEAKDWASEDED